jgi:hypothetical protein
MATLSLNLLSSLLMILKKKEKKEKTILLLLLLFYHINASFYHRFISLGYYSGWGDLLTKRTGLAM